MLENDSSDEWKSSVQQSKKRKLESAKATSQWIQVNFKPATSQANQRIIEISDSEDDTSILSVSECSDSDFEPRVTKRKRGSTEKNVTSKNEMILKSRMNTTRPAVPVYQSATSSKAVKEILPKGQLTVPRPALQSFRLPTSMNEAKKAEKKSIFERQEKEKLLSQLQSEEDENVPEIILDVNPQKNIKIVVHKKVAKHLKPHQIEGVKHMYDCCYGRALRNANDQGSGSILAHSMGLGKTLQLITLLHTIINYPEFNTNRILILCPKSTLSNWKAEIYKWIGSIQNSRSLQIYEFSDTIQKRRQLDKLKNFSSHTQKRNKAGCFLMGYESFRSLVFYGGEKKKKPDSKLSTEDIRIRGLVQQHLLDAVCDEGHIIKNLKSSTNRAVTQIKTKRRIILSGTPMQNNLVEYYGMVNFVKPSFLGRLEDFRFTYANPIAKGQHKDSTPQEIKLMRLQSINLNRELQSFVHRREVSILQQDLPEKFEYVLHIPMSEKQHQLYEHYLKENPYQVNFKRLFADYTEMRKIWTHPKHLELSYENSAKQNKIDKVADESKRNLSRNENEYEADDDESDTEIDPINDTSVMHNWWKSFVTEEDLNTISQSPKFQIMFEIMNACERKEEKCLIFSTSVVCLSLVEYFLARYKSWKTNVDYYRLDGSIKNDRRHEMIVQFNKPENKKVKLFLISTKAGGQGINLTAANRLILLDTSWNPSVDQQSIFRIFRFGQQKKCYIYRLLSMGTMEDKMYSRSVTKQAMSLRVIDKQQIDRNYSMAELEELYTLTKPDIKEREIPIPPKDELLAYLLDKFPDKVYKYHEHNSVLDNKFEKEITEEEKQEALVLFNMNKLKDQSARATKVYENASDLLAVNASTSEAGLQLLYGYDLPVASTSKPTFQLQHGPNFSNVEPSTVTQAAFNGVKITQQQPYQTVASTSKPAFQLQQAAFNGVKISQQQPYQTVASTSKPTFQLQQGPNFSNVEPSTITQAAFNGVKISQQQPYRKYDSHDY